MTTAQRAESNFLDPSVLARIGNLELLAKTVVEGFINGLHRAPHLGSSTDFAEHRAYMPGDDIRRIDWRLYGRTDRHFVKEYEADTNSNLLIALDVSPSMRYRGDPENPSALSKLEYGCYLAAALAYFSSTQRDRVGLATFDGGLSDYVPCSAKHLQLVLHSLDQANKAGRAAAVEGAKSLATSLLEPLRKLSESTRRRSIVVLISDLYEDAGAVLDALTQVRGRGNDLIVFHVLDRTELSFPFADSSNFIDVETGEKMAVIPEYLRDEYKKVITEHTDSLARKTREQNVDYALLDTSKPLDQALFRYLSARQRGRTVR